jgi:hypothetical protein
MWEALSHRLILFTPITALVCTHRIAWVASPQLVPVVGGMMMGGSARQRPPHSHGHSSVYGDIGVIDTRLQHQVHSHLEDHSASSSASSSSSSSAPGIHVAGGASVIAPKAQICSLIPNFYSASLCRKQNASHLKKQRGPSATAAGMLFVVFSTMIL